MNTTLRRQQPTLLPKKTSQLTYAEGAETGRRADKARYIKHGRGVVLPRAALNTTGSYPPCFPVDPVTRVRAVQLQTPRAVASHMSALALHGLKYFVDDQPTTVFTNSRTNRVALSPIDPAHCPELAPRQRTNWLHIKHGGSGTPTCHPDRDFPEFRAQTPIAALASCIAAMNKEDTCVETDRWIAPHIVGMNAQEAGMIQLADAVLTLMASEVQPTMCGCEQWIRQQAKGLVDARLFRKIVNQATSAAESPPETSMRLVATSAVGAGFTSFPQVEVTLGGQYRTTIDLLIVRTGSTLCRELSAKIGRRQNPVCSVSGIDDPTPCSSRIFQRRATVELFGNEALWTTHPHVALFYDGSHHLSRKQHDFDIDLDIELKAWGVSLLRVTNRKLKQTAELMGDILSALRMA